MNPITASVAIITLFLAPTLALAQPAISDAFTAGRNCSQAELALDRGTALFRQGDVEGSIAEFDKAIEFDPSKRTYLWQRGISLYYLNRFKKGAEQFRLDVTQSPNDTEEAIWCFVCETKLYGAAQARERFLKVGRDRRWVMREAYKMVKDEGNPEKFVNAFRGRPHKYFYASLYAGLYYESQNEENAAKRYIVSAYKTRYGQNSRDYMAAVAKVHCQLRNWID
ncbi:Tetratricopeptide repeat (TPR)-like superfamily protein [Euphorbia peplus]|nr:Tetratricopeptide repeat (TPR)-like superfamily protein [Euphorbia peplus]